MIEIVAVVGSKVDFAIWREDGVGKVRKAVVDEAVASMFPFGPRVGEIDMQRCDGKWRQ